MVEFVERHGGKIRGVLSCFDRVVITGTLPDICFNGAAERYFRVHRKRLFDYAPWANKLRDELRVNAERVAAAHGIGITHIRRTRSQRKEDIVAAVVDERGDAPGLVCILSAMERCPCYRPWYDQTTKQTRLKPSENKCLHYYFYFIDDALGLCYLRVPSWAPFRLQAYFNGHNALAAALRRAGIEYTMEDNAFVEIADFEAAQRLADTLSVEDVHRRLESYARRFCPVLRHFPAGVHWSIMQVEYATDIVFNHRDALAPIYQGIVHTAIHAVRADDIATFLGRRLTGHFQREAGTDFKLRLPGTRIKHHMGPASIKMYDKRGRVLRIETTVNDVTFFKHHRRVEHRDGTTGFMLAPVKKTIYSLTVMAKLLGAANRRYLAFLAHLDDHHTGREALGKLTKRVRKGARSFRGLNFFDADDLALCRAIVRGENVISGFTNRMLQKALPGKSAAQIGRALKRLRSHGLIKKIGRTYKYYLTKLGMRALTAGLKLRELVIIPALAAPART